MSLAALAHRHPRIVDWGIFIDRAPAAGWLGLQFLALMPTWAWMVQRMRDGSDDPLGLLALVALAALTWNRRRELRASPRLGWLALAGAGTVLATLLRTGLGGLPALPPLAAGLVAVLALACGLLAFLPRNVGRLGSRCWRCRCCRRSSSMRAIRCAWSRRRPAGGCSRQASR